MGLEVMESDSKTHLDSSLRINVSMITGAFAGSGVTLELLIPLDDICCCCFANANVDDAILLKRLRLAFKGLDRSLMQQLYRRDGCASPGNQ